jgi:glucose/arabinose dehydrogenase
VIPPYDADHVVRISVERTSCRWALFFAFLSIIGIDILTRSFSAPVLAKRDAAREFDTSQHHIRVTTVAQGLERPWSLTFLPGGDMLVTERPGRLRVLRNGVLQPRPVAGVPQVHAEEHGGLLEVTPHPRFADNSFLYLTYTKVGPQGVTVALARGRLTGDTLLDVREIFVADAWAPNNVHFGGRLAFGGDRRLFMTIGDRNQRGRAQNPADHAGSIVRLLEDGGVPRDNPFVERPGMRPEIYSYGHRNPQGLAFDPATGALWQHEHGPQGGDELNRILAGANYGWPEVTYGREYNGGIISHRPWRPDMEQPVVFWSPSIGVSGLTFYTGAALPGWQTSILVGALVGQQLQRIVFSDQGPVEREAMLAPLGHRVRDVRQGPDDLVYILTDGDDASILRLERGEW